MIPVDQGAEGLFSSFLRVRRMKAALPYLQGKVLDSGCGIGKWTDRLDTPGEHVWLN